MWIEDNPDYSPYFGCPFEVEEEEVEKQHLIAF